MTKTKDMNQEDAQMQALMAKEKINSLGKINLDKGKPEIDDKVKLTIGLHLIDQDNLAYSGIFYPNDTSIKYRAAVGAEVKHFASVDETSALAVDDAMKQIIDSCTSIFNSKGAKISYKNIMSVDRFILALKIREATYVNPESKMNYQASCNCGCDFDIELATNNITSPELNEHQLKHYDETLKCFLLETKSYGDLKIQPLTIHREELYRNYVISLHESGKKIDKLFSELYWMFINEDNQYDKNIISTLYDNYIKLINDKKALAFYIEMNDRLKLEPLTKVMGVCPDCSQEVYKDITFPRGIKYLFLDTNSVDSEFS